MAEVLQSVVVSRFVAPSNFNIFEGLIVARLAVNYFISMKPVHLASKKLCQSDDIFCGMLFHSNYFRCRLHYEEGRVLHMPDPSPLGHTIHHTIQSVFD